MTTARRSLIIAAALAVVVVAFCGWFGAFGRARPTTQILIVTLDTTRADRLGCYGYATAATPTLDRIALSGVKFNRASSPAPLTLPSHATLFTGLYPPEHALRTNGRGRLPESIPTLAAILQQAGYNTAGFVSSFVLDSKFGLDRGWQFYDDSLAQASDPTDSLQRHRPADAVVDSALAWLKSADKAPMCLWVHFYDPHFPYNDHQAQFGHTFQGRPYDAELAFVDRELQRLLDGIAAAGRADNLMILVVGDHGEGLEQHVELTHGYTLYEATQRVPLLLSCPGRVGKNLAVDVPVSLADILPTVLDVLDLPPPGPISGRSLRPALSGAPLTGSACYAMTDDPFLQNGWAPLRSLVVDRWKYIHTREPELYDLAADPGENHNLYAADSEQAVSMRKQLETMEAKFVVKAAPSVQLSARETETLKSLGYLGGLASGSTTQDSTDAPDVKQMLKFDRAAQLALDLLRSGDVDGAIDHLRSLVAEAPLHSASRIFLGEALEQKGRVNEALAFYEEVLKQKPDHLDARIHLGSALATANRTEAALEQFDEALRISPESAAARYNLGLLLSRIGRTEEARQQLEETLRQDDRFPDVHTALADICLQQGKSAAARKHYEDEIAINSQSWQARTNLAALLAESKPEAAEQLLIDAESIAPQEPMVLYNRGAFLLLRQRPREAIPFLERAIKHSPSPNPAAEKELERARRLAAD